MRNLRLVEKRMGENGKPVLVLPEIRNNFFKIGILRY